jgi:CRISPR-associated protein Cas2
MGNLRFFLVSYDISDQKRWRSVYRIMKEFGTRIHYSVFRCDLTPMGKMELVIALSEVINHNEDRVMIVDLGQVRDDVEGTIDFLGQVPEEDCGQQLII